MINLCVTRKPECCVELSDQCIVGDTISNSLILTDLVAASAARAVIDREEQDKEIVSANCSLTPYLKPSSLVEAIDKEYGIHQIKEHLGIPLENIMFVGDALFLGGNDSAALRTGIPCFEVKGTEDTKNLIRYLARL